MLYNIGTIAINGNTATGTGTNWTAPASQVRAGQTIIVMSNPVQLFQISSVNSATSLTVTPAASPALSGQKYGILVSDIISVDGLAQAMSQLIKEYDENIGAWEIFATTSANQTITVTINGAAVNIPGIGGIARKGANSDITSLEGLTTAISIEQGGTGKKTKDDARIALSAASAGSNSDITSLTGLTTALSIEQGGTGAKTVPDARLKLGLGSSATRDAYSTSGRMLSEGDFGVGGAASATANELACGFYRTVAGASGNPLNNSGVILNYQVYGAAAYTRFATSYELAVPRIFVSTKVNNTYYPYYELYTTGNTTRAADGSIKAASPIVRIVKSKDDCTRPDIDEADFAWCGAGVANAEAEGVTLTREATGVYLLKGSAGLAKSGWQMSPPRDPQGSGDMGIVEAEQAEDGSLIIRLYKRRYVLSDDGDIKLQKGVAIDVPPTSWIDVRLDMPENSIWNQRAESALEE
ncbi:phage tail protein [Escherichia coli]|nr:phage tail protein [Escherichia coli]